MRILPVQSYYGYKTKNNVKFGITDKPERNDIPKEYIKNAQDFIDSRYSRDKNQRIKAMMSFKEGNQYVNTLVSSVLPHEGIKFGEEYLDQTRGIYYTTPIERMVRDNDVEGLEMIFENNLPQEYKDVLAKHVIDCYTKDETGYYSLFHTNNWFGEKMPLLRTILPAVKNSSPELQEHFPMHKVLSRFYPGSYYSVSGGHYFSQDNDDKIALDEIIDSFHPDSKRALLEQFFNAINDDCNNNKYFDSLNKHFVDKLCEGVSGSYDTTVKLQNRIERYYNRIDGLSKLFGEKEI